MKSSATALAHAAGLTTQSYIRCQISPQPANDNEAVIDLFAGGGGTSEGVFEAFGFHPDIAVNHNEEALALHAKNHPSTVHLREDIRKINVERTILEHLGGRRVAILWASPDCRHFSKASGDQLKDRGIRGLAWEVLRWSAGIKRATGYLPRLVALENVEEIQTWGPVHRYGAKAGSINKKRQGETWDLFIANLKALGFKRVEWRELIAADYGVPTTRKRLYLVAMSEDYDGDWPQKTHAPRAKISAVSQGDLFPSPDRLQPYRSAASIIDWSLKPPSIFSRERPLKPKTLSRIAKGIQRYVIDSPDPFIVPVTHTKGWNATKSAEDPLGAITTSKGGEFALGAPTIIPVNHGGGEDRCYDPLDPARTVTAAPRGEQALATAYLGRQFGSTVSGRDLADPHPTAMTEGAGGKSQLVTAHLSRMAKGSTGSEAADPTLTACAHAKDALVAPVIDKYYGSGVAADAADPLDTATAKARFGLASAFMEQANTGMVGHHALEPVSTIVGRGTTQRLVDVMLERVEAIEGTVRRKVLEFLWSQFGEPSADELNDPMATAMGRLRLGLVRIGGAIYKIVDIGMRMLTARELFRAQGFKDSYDLDVFFKGKPLSKTALIRMAGNSVCPDMARLILLAFAPPSMRQRAAA